MHFAFCILSRNTDFLSRIPGGVFVSGSVLVDLAFWGFSFVSCSGRQGRSAVGWGGLLGGGGRTSADDHGSAWARWRGREGGGVARRRRRRVRSWYAMGIAIAMAMARARAIKEFTYRREWDTYTLKKLGHPVPVGSAWCSGVCRLRVPQLSPRQSHANIIPSKSPPVHPPLLDLPADFPFQQRPGFYIPSEGLADGVMKPLELFL